MFSLSDNAGTLALVVVGCLSLGCIIEAITRARENRQRIANRQKPELKVAPPLFLAIGSGIGFLVLLATQH